MNAERLRQIEELYHSAREREPGERSAFWPSLPRVSAELGGCKVELLLAQDVSNDDAVGEKILDRPAWEAAPSLLGQPGSARLIPGAQIGPYKIEAALGAGGMGEVYRAVDTRLGRTVALSRSPSQHFGERFEREARAIAALNHPNICTLYDVGPNYLVMELIEGPTLAERIEKGPVPLEESLGIAKQIADALEAAHEKGITHRDLKPGNIKIKPDGTVKVLDFGLAKVSSAPAGESPEATATLTTRAGMILGTAAYMSPEQAQGKPVDKRADIWAFGVVLYEMLTGRRMFQGETVSETLAAVLKDEPEWNRVPHKAQRLLRRCLEKDPKRRLRDIADAMTLIDDTPQGTALRHNKLPWAVAGGLALVLIISFYYFDRPAPLRPLVRLNAEIAADTPLARIAGGVLALSPDGARLALILRGADGKVRLHTRLLQQNQVTPLAGTENAFSPFFSPDGEWIGFFADGKLKRFRWRAALRSRCATRPSPTAQAGATTAISSRRSVAIADSGGCLPPAGGACRSRN